VPSVDEISQEPPFGVRTLDGASASPHLKYPSLDMGTVCPVFAETGECRYVFAFFAFSSEAFAFGL
jgi:tRNA-dihydrouridine synthase 3